MKRRFKDNDTAFVVTIVTLMLAFFWLFAVSIYVEYNEAAESRKIEKQQLIHVDSDENIVYNYDTCGRIIAKNEYNPDTKITTNYYYMYDGNTLNHVQIVTIDEDGKILDSLE